LLLIFLPNYCLFAVVAYYKNETFIKNFGKKLKEVRESKGFSQEKLSLVTNISQSQIARTELGQVNTSISHLALYAHALGIPPKDLLDF
jgi:transcriptional regulator with XRE-family HTH domain